VFLPSKEKKSVQKDNGAQHEKKEKQEIRLDIKQREIS